MSAERAYRRRDAVSAAMRAAESAPLDPAALAYMNVETRKRYPRSARGYEFMAGFRARMADVPYFWDFSQGARQTAYRKGYEAAEKFLAAEGGA